VTNSHYRRTVTHIKRNKTGMIGYNTETERFKGMVWKQAAIDY